MRKTDKNIAIVTMILITGLLFLSINRYTSTKKEVAQQSSESTISEADTSAAVRSDDDLSAEESASVIPLITVQELNQKIITDAENTTVIDMRTKPDFDKGHIKGSYFMADLMPSALRRNVILVTENGNEDTIISYYRDIAKNNTVFNLSGGITQWSQNGFSLVTPASEQTFANASKVQYLEPRDIAVMLKDADKAGDVVILDTRREGNFTAGHIKGALNIPLSDLEYRYNEIPFGHKIIVYGSNDTASFQSGVLLYDLGFMGAKTIKGGFDAWRTYGYEITQ